MHNSMHTGRNEALFVHSGFLVKLCPEFLSACEDEDLRCSFLIGEALTEPVCSTKVFIFVKSAGT